MPSYTLTLSPSGAVVEAAAALPLRLEQAYKQSNRAIPQPVPFLAQVDTGASHTCISEEIAHRLGLAPVGRVAISTPSSSSFWCGRYFLRLMLTDSFAWEDIVLATPFLSDQSVRCLIGRDILSKTLLVYNGPANQFTLCV